MVKKTQHIRSVFYSLHIQFNDLSGGWWSADVLSDIKGSIAIECGSHRYIEPQDNGLLKLGESHDIGNGMICK